MRISPERECDEKPDKCLGNLRSELSDQAQPAKRADDLDVE